MKPLLVALAIVISSMISSLSSYQCGVRKLNINRLIVNGQNTYPGEWPWHVAVYHRSGVSDSYACGGTLISEFYVLTADHCIKGDNGFVLSPHRVFVRVGVYNFQDPDPQTLQQHGIQQIHEFGVSSNLKNDIALLELSSKVLFTNYVQPACLNEVEDLTNQYGTAVGWGVTEYNDLSPVLKSSQMPVVSTIQCLESNDGIFRPVLDSSTICAGYLNGTTVCNGDSGGGLHFERNGVWFVGGIVSFTAPRDSSFKCHTKSYAGFTNVYRYITWIRTVTGHHTPNRKTPTQFPIILPQDCGRYLVNRINRGSTANPYEFPWMVEIITKNITQNLPTRTPGSLIHKRYVLTQAFGKIIGFALLAYVRLGEYNHRAIKCQRSFEIGCDLAVQDINIESITIHPEFNDITIQNNIALMRLAEDAIFTDNIQPVCLPTTSVYVPEYIVAGWGRAFKGGELSDILQKAIVPAIGLSECEREIRRDKIFYVGEGVICAGKEGTPNTCSGDNGGPMGYPFRYLDSSVRFVQYGIASVHWCGHGPSIFTNVSYYMKWILMTLKP